MQTKAAVLGEKVMNATEDTRRLSEQEKRLFRAVDAVFSRVQEESGVIGKQNVQAFFRALGKEMEVPLSEFSVGRLMFEYGDIALEGLTRGGTSRLCNGKLFRKLFGLESAQVPTRLFNEAEFGLKEKLAAIQKSPYSPMLPGRRGSAMAPPSAERKENADAGEVAPREEICEVRAMLEGGEEISPVESQATSQPQTNLGSPSEDSEEEKEEDDEDPKDLIEYALRCPQDKSETSAPEYRLISKIFADGNCRLDGVEKACKREVHAQFSEERAQKEHMVLLFFSNTVEYVSELFAEPRGFDDLHGRSPQDLIFSADLSIAYHFYRRYGEMSGSSNVQPQEQTERGDRRWRAIVAAVILDKVWKEKKSYALFALNFEERTEALMKRGYTSVFFANDNFYLILSPRFCLPVYMIDFSFL